MIENDPPEPGSAPDSGRVPRWRSRSLIVVVAVVVVIMEGIERRFDVVLY
jgi:hypothetical protein